MPYMAVPPPPPPPPRADIAWLEPFTWQKATAPRQVPRASRRRQGAPARRATLSSMYM